MNIDNNLTLITENGMEYNFMKRNLIRCEIEGVKKGYSYTDDGFYKYSECEHFILEIKTKSIKNLNNFLHSPIVSVITDNEKIYVPFLLKQDKNIFQEYYLSENQILYILISETKNFEDIYDIDMINDPLYIDYITGGN